MKILFVTSRFPYPPLKGDKIRGYYPIKHLSCRHTIDLLSYSDDTLRDEAYVGEMGKYCRKIRTVMVSRLAFNLKLAAAVFSSQPSQVYCYRSKAMKKAIEEMSSANKYDIIHLVCGRIAWLAKYVEGVPTVLDWIDALSLSTRRMWESEEAWTKKGMYWWEWRKMAAFERDNLKTCDYSIVTSPLDRNTLGLDSIEIIPNGVDSAVFSPSYAEKDIDIVFTGNMSYFPNAQAVDNFMKNIFPAIRKARPSTRFYIVGINPSPAVLRWKNYPGVVITGFVEDIAGVLKRSRIFIAPLTAGAGIQNKILEAMACGLPVVTTSYGNAGVQAEDGREVIVRNNPGEFADAVLKLFEDEHRGRGIGQNARDLVMREFNWEAVARRLEQIYGQISRHRGSSSIEGSSKAVRAHFAKGSMEGE